MRFAQFTPGMVIAAGQRIVGEDEIIGFAQQYDPQWFHTDPRRAQESRWKGLIASGWLTCAVAMELAVRHVLFDSESIGSPGVEYVKWPSPLRAGDTVELRMEVLEARLSRSGRVGVVRWRWALNTLRGSAVLDLIATSLFQLSQPGDCPPAGE